PSAGPQRASRAGAPAIWGRDGLLPAARRAGPHAPLDCLSGQFAQCVGGDPPSGTRINLLDPLRRRDRFPVQRGIPFPDVPEGPVHRLANEVSIVRRFPGDRIQEREEGGVLGPLVVPRYPRHHREPRPFYELLAAPAPLEGL